MVERRLTKILLVSNTIVIALLLQGVFIESQANPFMGLWISENYPFLLFLLDQRIVSAISGVMLGGIVLWVSFLAWRAKPRRLGLKSRSRKIEETVPTAPGSREKSRSTFVRLLSYLRPNWHYAVAIGVAIIFSAALDLAQPWIMGFLLFGEVIDKRNLTVLPSVLALLAGAFVFKEVLSFLGDYLTEILSQRTVHRLRYDLYTHIEHLPVRFLDHSRSGELISRVMSDTDEVQSVLTQDMSGLARDLVLVVLASSLLFYSDPRIAAIVLPIVIGLATIVNFFKRRVKRSSKRIREAVADLSARAYEVISGIRIVKSFSMERHEAKVFRERSLSIVRSRIRLTRLSSVYSSMTNMLTTLGTLALIWIIAPSVVSGALTLGALVAYLGLLDKMFKPLMGLSKVNLKIQKAVAAGERIFEIRDQGPEVLDSPEAIVPPAVLGRVEFNHVSFEYETDRKVLEDFSLQIQPGETVAIVGSSGVGKSTIVSLLLRLYEPNAGQILIDGYPLNTMKLEFLRRNVGLVIQDPFLFSGTVGENIAYGKIDASDDEIVRAAQLANAHEFIISLPNGYHTGIGERGVTLSVGERQRVAVARALIKDPRILVLDEATSNVDSESEALIQEALKNLAGDRTIIIVAHRLSTIMDADRIAVIEDGRIVEMGTHETLLQRRGTYSRLYRAQLTPQTPVVEQQVSKPRHERPREETA